MPDLAKILMSLPLSWGVAHPELGHNVRGEGLGVPVHVDRRNLVEDWSTPDPRKAGLIHGAGFEAQDMAPEFFEDPEMRGAMRIAAGLEKVLYPFTTKMFARGVEDGGDIGGMERASGSKLARALLLASAGSDMYSGFADPDAPHLDFTMLDGGNSAAPGLKLTVKTDAMNQLFEKLFAGGE